MKKILLFFLLLLSFNSFAQYASTHYIAPGPWKYWSKANQLVISTLETNPVSVEVFKSDGTPITIFSNVTGPLSVVDTAPLSVVFDGVPKATDRNVSEIKYDAEGIIIKASAPIFVNVRNIESNAGPGLIFSTGNGSLTSFGDEGKGQEFRVGYYRKNVTGLNNETGTKVNGAPIYSVMATEDETEVVLPTTPTETTITLNKGQSWLFYAPMGSLVTADKPVVMNVGNWKEQNVMFCEDGTFDQLAPVNEWGTNYVVVRGNGYAGTEPVNPEQTLIIAAEANTTVDIINYDATGVQIGTLTVTLGNAGDIYNFHHGDAKTKYSSSYIHSDKKISVISGTADDCEAAISTVLPIGGCAGSTDIRTKKFIDYYGKDLTYFGYIIVESETEPVLMNGQDIETLTGTKRVPLGTSGLYLIRFTSANIKTPTDLYIHSDLPLTVCLVQGLLNGGGTQYSMSAFFSAFSKAALPPQLESSNDDCSVVITSEEEGYPEYAWYLNGEFYKTTETNKLVVTESGNYSVQFLQDCGYSGLSLPTAIEVTPCADLSLTKETTAQDKLDVTFTITVTNNSELFTETNTIVTDVLPSGLTYVSSTASVGAYDETTGIWNVGSLAPDQIETLVMICEINSTGDDYVNNASVKGNLLDKNLDNNKDSATIELFTADIDAVKDDGEAFYQIGGELNYTITVTNKGPQKALNVKVFDPMPHETTEMSWEGNNNSGTGDLLDYIKELEVGQEVLYNVALRVPKGHFGAFTNTVEISSPNIIDPIPECTECSDTDIPDFSIPKGISPNGDGDNDYLDLEGYFISKIVIYNRYGTEVYSKKDYVNEWYGQNNNGKLLPAGTYFYTVEVQGVPYKSGYIQVIREVK